MTNDPDPDRYGVGETKPHPLHRCVCLTEEKCNRQTREPICINQSNRTSRKPKQVFTIEKQRNSRAVRTHQMNQQIDPGLTINTRTLFYCNKQRLTSHGVVQLPQPAVHHVVRGRNQHELLVAKRRRLLKSGNEIQRPGQGLPVRGQGRQYDPLKWDGFRQSKITSGTPKKISILDILCVLSKLRR